MLIFDGPQKVKFDINKRFKKSGYDQNRICNACGKQVVNKNKTGYCFRCLVIKNRIEKRLNSKSFLSNDGYIYIFIDTRYIAEHHYVWETANNKKVELGHCIHHINGIKTDNRLENLLYMKKTDHNSNTIVMLTQNKIKKLEDRIKELEAKLSEKQRTG